MAFLSSAMSFDKTLEVGHKAPKIETIDGINVGYDANSAGKNKLISFWNPKKPASRIANKNLNQKYEGQREEMEFISICTDSDSDLMKEVMKMDGIESDISLSYSDVSPRVFKDYGVEDEPKAFLISTDGKILSIL